jgi:hypothetical protein
MGPIQGIYKSALDITRSADVMLNANNRLLSLHKTAMPRV